MTIQASPSSTYPLARGWRAIFIVASILLAAVPFLPFLLGSKVSGTPLDFVCLGLFMGGLAAMSLFYGVLFRLSTSPAGIESRMAFLRVAGSWNTVQRVEVNAFGVVNLIFSQPHTRSRLFGWYLRPLGYDRLIQISPFVEDWQNSELLNDIRRYAPQASIPDELVNRPHVQWRYQTSSLAIYYLVSLYAMMLIVRLGDQAISVLIRAVALPQWSLMVWNLAFIGGLGGLVGGGVELLNYDSWLRAHTQHVAKYARVCYLLPLSGFAIGLLVELTTQVVFPLFDATGPMPTIVYLLRLSPLFLAILQVNMIPRLWPELHGTGERGT